MPFTTCPECNTESMAPRELVGLVWDCPKCGTPFVVTEDSDSTPFPRRRKKSRSWSLMLIGLAVLSVVGGAIAIISSNRAPRPLEMVTGERTIGDLVQHFQRSGVKGTYGPKLAVGAGEKEGGWYEGDGFLVEVWRFEDQTTAESMEKSGAVGNRVYRNGRFILIDHKNGAAAVAAFKRF